MFSMKKIKKYFLTIGTASAVMVPLVATTACSYPSEQAGIDKLTKDMVQDLVTSKINGAYKDKSKISVNSVIFSYFDKMEDPSGKYDRAQFLINVDPNDTQKYQNEIEVTIQAKGDDQNGILTLTIVGINTPHIHITTSKQNTLIDRQWNIDGFKTKA